jgi:5-methylcytosine-specific restriction protein A
MPWFRKLRREQASFSLGFNRISDPDIVAELDRLFKQRGEDAFVPPDEIEAPWQYFEGAIRKVSVNRYERSRSARDACLNHYGRRCSVCHPDFERVYGEIGRDFIQVHHLKPLAEIGAKYRIDPIADLRPICPNSHAMIHSGKNMMSVEELKKVTKKRARLR